MATSFMILHFNDVYEIQSREKEPVGGAARFISKIKEFDSEDPLVLFSGDCFSPSILGTITHGRHMVPVLNLCGIDVACYGNHDFDYGVEALEKLVNSTNFPWLMSNAYDKKHQKFLGGGLKKLILDWKGYKIGFIGLIEKEWLRTLSTLPLEQVEYVDFVEEGRRLAKLLREKDNVDFVFALTHMRLPNDLKLAKEVEEIDLIFGGHDHDFVVEKVDTRWVIKSGNDFRDLNKIMVTIDENKKLDLTYERLVIKESIPQDPEALKIIQEFDAVVGKKMEKTLGKIGVDLDGRFNKIRTQETGLSNWIADIMKSALKSDIAILNSGTIRVDDIIGVGFFKMKNLVTLLPYPDEVVVLGLTGKQVIEALENGVSQYPKLEGRFPCVSGIRFEYDPSLPPGSRVIQDTVFVNGERIQLENKEYTVATKSYLAKGKDGYDVFQQGRVIVDDEDGPVLPNLVRNYFIMMEVVEAFQSKKYWDSQELVPSKSDETLLKVARCMIKRTKFKASHQTGSVDHRVCVSTKVDGRITRRSN